jgi:hypothetical protein
MPFPKSTRLPPVAIGSLRVNLADVPATGSAPAFKKATYHIELLDANGAVADTVSGDLRPHLTGPQLNGLVNLLDQLRVKATEALP